MIATAEIQTDLIRLILETRDPRFLSLIRAYVLSLREREISPDELDADGLSPYHYELIEKGAEQLRNGQSMPWEEVKKLMEARRERWATSAKDLLEL